MRVYAGGDRESRESEQMLEMGVLLDQHNPETVVEGGCELGGGVDAYMSRWSEV